MQEGQAIAFLDGFFDVFIDKDGLGIVVTTMYNSGGQWRQLRPWTQLPRGQHG